MFSLLLSQSRGGALGFGAGLAVIAWFLWPKWGRLLVIGGACFALLSIWMPAASGIRSTFGLDALLGDGPRQVTPENFATEERLAHWGAALRMWGSEPWLGIGAGNFPDRFREFTPHWRFRISRGHAHSAYLQAAAQAGVVGLGCYLVLLGTAWGRFRGRLTQSEAAQSNGFLVAALAVTAAIAVHGLFEYLHVLSLGIALSAIWALPEGEFFSPMDETTNHGSD
jgi:O-antigen ligase